MNIKGIVKKATLMGCILGVSMSLSGCAQKQAKSINFFNYGANIDAETLKAFDLWPCGYSEHCSRKWIST